MLENNLTQRQLVSLTSGSKPKILKSWSVSGFFTNITLLTGAAQAVR